MLKPAYRITIADQRIDTTSEPLASTVTAITVERETAPLVDRFDLTLGRVGSFAPERGDAAAIELGYAGEEGELAQVMAGLVEEVDARPERVRIVGLGAGALLARGRAEITFRDSAPADILRDLAGRAGAGVSRTGTSDVLPYYVIDGRRTFLSHLSELADLTGFDLYQNPEDEIVFEAFRSGRSIHPLRYREHVLDYHVERTVPPAARVESWGESPGASAGAESWSWLTKDFDPRKGAAGSGDGLALLEHSALRSPELAQRAADALLARIRNRRIRGHVTTLGNPGVQLGDAIRLSGMPDVDLNATHQVRSIRHRIDKAGGFTTRIGFRAIGGTA